MITLLLLILFENENRSEQKFSCKIKHSKTRQMFNLKFSTVKYTCLTYKNEITIKGVDEAN